jgi:hypothetical protein
MVPEVSFSERSETGRAIMAQLGRTFRANYEPSPTLPDNLQRLVDELDRRDGEPQRSGAETVAE